MDGRKRTVQVKFRVTEAERDLILEKMKLMEKRRSVSFVDASCMNAGDSSTM